MGTDVFYLARIRILIQQRSLVLIFTVLHFRCRMPRSFGRFAFMLWLVCAVALLVRTLERSPPTRPPFPRWPRLAHFKSASGRTKTFLPMQMTLVLLLSRVTEILGHDR